MTNITFHAFTSLLATEAGITEESASKVGTWLKNQGVLDFEAINDDFNDEQDPLGMTTEQVVS